MDFYKSQELWEAGSPRNFPITTRNPAHSSHTCQYMHRIHWLYPRRGLIWSICFFNSHKCSKKIVSSLIGWPEKMLFYLQEPACARLLFVLERGLSRLEIFCKTFYAKPVKASTSFRY